MAIGTAYTEPEAGWKRYDAADENVNFLGTWGTTSNRPFTNGSIRFTTAVGSSLTFYFKGTKLRLISETNGSYDTNIEIEIDGSKENFSINEGSTDYRSFVLTYEKLNLENKLHFVKITKTGNNTSPVNIDSIDIDESGELSKVNENDIMSKYGVAWFGFDEASGNVLDKLGNNYVGTVTGATRVEGWNGEGYAMKGANQNTSKVKFNNPIIPNGEKTIRFKVLFDILNDSILITRTQGSAGNGIQVGIKDKEVYITLYQKANALFRIDSNHSFKINKWYDFFITWDGTTEKDAVKFFIDEKIVYTATSIGLETGASLHNMSILGHFSNNDYHAVARIDDLQIYNKSLSPSDFTQKRLAFKTTDNKNLVVLEDKIREIPNLEENTLLQYGEVIREIDDAIDRRLPKDLTEAYTQYEIIDAMGISTVKAIEPTTAKELLGDTPQVIYYTQSDKSGIVVETETDPYSAYDYISETPEVMVYTESTDDIIISTVTEPFTIYDEFVDANGEPGEVEVLCYTDDTEAVGADMQITANWSPLDELVGDKEVVTWTSDENAALLLETEGVHEYTIVKQKNSIRMKDITGIQMIDSAAPFVVQKDNEDKYYTYYQGRFFAIPELNEYWLSTYGLTPASFNAIPMTEWEVFLDVNSGANTEYINFTYLFSNRTIYSNSASATLDTEHKVGKIFTTRLASKSTPSVDDFSISLEEYSLEGRLQAIEKINARNFAELQFKTSALLKAATLKFPNMTVLSFNSKDNEFVEVGANTKPITEKVLTINTFETDADGSVKGVTVDTENDFEDLTIS